jgi:hypothetical protein
VRNYSIAPTHPHRADRRALIAYEEQRMAKEQMIEMEDIVNEVLFDKSRDFAAAIEVRAMVTGTGEISAGVFTREADFSHCRRARRS